jgi:membrane-associated phospholipid phosphatase
LTLAISAAAAVAFGISRVVLGFHTPPEVVVGALVGLSGAALIARLAGRPPPVKQGRTRLLAAFLVVLLLFHGAHVHAETSIGRFARLLELWPLSACRAVPAA